jgi:hypothetical protein
MESSPICCGYATLEFTYIGYIPQHIAIRGQTTLSVILKEDAQTLDEVVVVGYGTQKKGCNSAVSTINFQEQASSRL